MRFFKTVGVRTVILFIIFILLGLLYFSPAIKLSKDFIASNPRPTNAAALPGAMKLLDLEFNKAVEEIKYLIQLQDTWYNYKYLFMGACGVRGSRLLVARPRQHNNGMHPTPLHAASHEGWNGGAGDAGR
ncbi:MAG TPA: hypothetical protein VEQ40_10335 [Pyrinomonadaceae bacterium]|nr:hypothetical protein [Pyrinomonadaceae bacterium]